MSDLNTYLSKVSQESELDLSDLFKIPFEQLTPKLGLENMEDLLSIVSYVTKEKEMMQALGVKDEKKWEQFIGFAEGMVSETTYRMINDHKPTKYSLGLAVPRPHGTYGTYNPVKSFGDFDFDLKSIPEVQVDLIKRFSPVRNQGARGTCVAQATVASREYFFNDSDKIDLCEQFLYWACKQKDGIPDKSGTYIDVAFQCLRNLGVCEEDTWPYNPEQVSNEGQGPPPEGAKEEAALYAIDDYEEFDREDIDMLCAILAEGRPLVFGIPVFKSWENYATQVRGKVFMPLPNDIAEGGHALVLVGYNRDGKSPGGGYFIFRNSWGEDWASECPYGAGYGTIPFGYIREYSSPLTSFTTDSIDTQNIASEDVDINDGVEDGNYIGKDSTGKYIAELASVTTDINGKKSIVIGRAHARQNSYQNKWLGYLGNLDEDVFKQKTGTPVYIDTKDHHIIFMCGMTNSGKSYTMGVLLENVLETEPEAAILIMDPHNEHTSFKRKSKNEEQLKKWILSPKAFNNVISLEIKEEEGLSISPEKQEFIFSVSDLSLNDWEKFFKVMGTRQRPLLRKILSKAKNGWTEYDFEFDYGVPHPGKENYGIDDMDAILRYDKEINDPVDKQFSEDTKRSMRGIIEEARDIPWIRDEGTPFESIIKPGFITTLNLDLEYDQFKTGIVGMLARKLYSLRARESDVIPKTYFVIDEVQLFAPTQSNEYSTQSVIKLAKEGRKRGISLICATQQPSATNVQILSQLDIMIGHRLNYKGDKQAWKDRTPLIEKRDAKALDIDTLPDHGVAYVADVKSRTPPVRIRIRPRMSEHGGKTRI